MPMIGFECEADSPESAVVTTDHCLACARRGALPGCPATAPVVRGIVTGLRPESFGLTVTTLLSCPRKRRLEQAEPYTLRPSELWWAYRGQLMHGIAAEYARQDGEAIAERRFSLLVGETEVSGQPDLVLVARRHLVDYKTTRAVPGPQRTWSCPESGRVIRTSAFAWRRKWMPCPHCTGKQHTARDIETRDPPQPYPRHVQQLSLYRLILWENGIEVETAELVYMDMQQQLRLPVALLPLNEARTLLERRLALHQQDAMPDVLTDPAEAWECDFCPVRAACDRLRE
jgi:CRISPR/Cas system-associated exonuclease Cas4 (RecB family)